MRRWWFYPLALLVLALLVEAGLLIGMAAMADRLDDPTPADVIIVLGAGINRYGVPSTTLVNRLDHALALYEAGYAHRFLVTGGQGEDEPEPEANVMRQYLVRRGVPEWAIVSETNALNTKENLLNAKALMTLSGMKTAIVVTSDYHLWRAMQVAEDVGIAASGAAAQNDPRAYYALRNSVRETLSWIKYVFTR